jgi:hypothetical protein
MKPAIKVNGRVIIINSIVVLIILGILWLVHNNIRKEGLEEQKPSVTANFFDKLITNIGNKFDNAGPEINNGKTFAEFKNDSPQLFDDLKSVFIKEKDIIYDLSFNTAVTSTIDTTTQPCSGKTFTKGKKFGSSLAINHVGKPVELNAVCSQLTSENCNLTDSCVWVGGKKCMAGDVDGPTIKVDSNGKDIDYAYYTYKSECYGSCGTGVNFANPCTEFKDEDPGVNIKCIARLWGQTECPNTRYVNKSLVQQLKDYSKASIKSIFSKAKDEDNFANCYGPNEADWPLPCELYPTDKSKKVSVRCLSKLYNDIGCDNTDAIITQKFAKANSYRTKKELINEFTKYHKGVDSNGIYDSNYSKCYGDDETGWPEPCSNTNDSSLGISQRCLTKLFVGTGCTEAKSLITPQYVLDNRGKNKLEFKQLFYSYKKNNDDESFKQCYGENRSTWPVRTMIVGLGWDYTIWFKRRRPGDVTYLENLPWELDYTPNQRNMTSMIQLMNGWFYGTGDDGLLYRKRYLGDPWEQDDVIVGPYLFMKVRIVWGLIIGIGLDRDGQEDSNGIWIEGTRNFFLYVIDRSPYNPKVSRIPDSGDCVDIMPVVNSYYQIAYVGTNGHIYKRRGWSDYEDKRLDNGRIMAFTLIPAGLTNADGTPKSGTTRVLGLDGGGFLYTENNPLEDKWVRVPLNNNIPFRNIGFVVISNNTPADSTDPAVRIPVGY